MEDEERKVQQAKETNESLKESHLSEIAELTSNFEHEKLMLKNKHSQRNYSMRRN